MCHPEFSSTLSMIGEYAGGRSYAMIRHPELVEGSYTTSFSSFFGSQKTRPERSEEVLLG